MTVDFRTLLKERTRNEAHEERWFEDLEIGDAFYLSIQASGLHASTPEKLLDNVYDYEAFQVTLQTKHGVFTCGRKGAWQHLQEKSWWSLFEEDTPILFVAEKLPVAEVQKVYEDVVAAVAAHPEMTKRACGSALKIN